MSHSYLRLPRNIYLLSVNQVIGGSTATIVTLLGGLIGAAIAPSPTLATLPATTMIVGIAASTIPAALLMKRIGRRKGFMIAAFIALCATLLAAYAVTTSNFSLFCIATFFIGSNGAFVQQYRFAAAESVNKADAGKAVGFLLMAGIASGIVGPEIAKRTKDWFSLPEYTGPFIFLAILLGITIITLSFLRDTKIHEEDLEKSERPLRSIITQPYFFIAVLAAACGYGVMTFIMTATPVHLHSMAHYSMDSTVFVIQSHIIAMYIPSLFTGMLIQRFGVFKVLVAGLASFALTIALGVSAHTLLPYWVALVLLGIGWNFLYISSTVLLAQSHSHTERFKAQGVNDFVVVTMQMFASFFAGGILFSRGWINLNLLTIPLILVVFIIFFVNRKNIYAISSSER